MFVQKRFKRHINWSCIEEKYVISYCFLRKLLQIHKDKSQDICKLTLLHRQLQLPSIQYRLNLSRFSIGCGILGYIMSQVACLYNSITFLSGKDTGSPIWYDLVYGWSEIICIAFVIFVFGILADVNNVSQQVQQKINGRHELKRNKRFKRWFQSCPVFKIYFGGSNYFERLTPLNIQNFAINQTVSWMLIKQ